MADTTPQAFNEASSQNSTQSLDSLFYKPAEAFFRDHTHTALTFDDITLATLYSEVLPRDAQLDTLLAPNLPLRMPIVSADMDTVTEAEMAIALARCGGLGLIHCNMPERVQLSEVSRVKNNVHGLIADPIKASPDQSIGELLAYLEEKSFTFRTFPVVDKDGRLLGLLPGQVVRPRHADKKVFEVMTPRALAPTICDTELGADPIGSADHFFSEHVGTNKLLVVDGSDRLRGLFTLSDVERIRQEQNAQMKPARDGSFRLLCGASLAPARTAAGELDRDRILAHVNGLVERGVDVVAISTAHGHSKGVGDTVRLVRSVFKELSIIAGNVTSGAGVEYLAQCGANVVKVGQGPGSICTTRIVAGVGIPQLTALYVAKEAAARLGVTILADGGISKSGDAVKALTLANAVVCGGLLAGCPEAPGSVMEINGKLYKQYRGMGSLAAMNAGSAARYGHASKDSARKVAAEGIEALKELSPKLDQVVFQLAGGIQSGMGYLGARNLSELRAKARYIRVTPAGQRESAPHDVIEVKTGNQ
ncbi:MAG: CBS domain-containing protein [Verrucomicrobia bacterium]|nr:CBS domain-containing protein [Verrucomicrobiota bacterium]